MAEYALLFFTCADLFYLVLTFFLKKRHFDLALSYYLTQHFILIIHILNAHMDKRMTNVCICKYMYGRRIEKRLEEEKKESERPVSRLLLSSW
jgi:hypothetical protein